MKPKKSNAQLDPLPISFKWNKISKIKFLDELSSQNVVNHLDNFSTKCLKDDLYDVDIAVKDFTEVIFNVAKSTLPVRLSRAGSKKPKNVKKKQKSWFDKSCFELKKEVPRLGKLVSKFPLILFYVEDFLW